MVNIEGPHRELPKDDSVFDPKKHEKTVHTKGPLKGKETWVRKSAIESDKEAVEEANIRNSVAEKPNWLIRLFDKSKNPENYLGLVHEEALEKELEGLQDYPSNRIYGKYNGHKIDIGYYDGRFRDPEGTVDDIKITADDAKKIFKKIRPLLAQREKNRAKLNRTKKKLAMLPTKKPVLEILGKLSPKKNLELEEKSAPKQLGPKKEE